MSEHALPNILSKNFSESDLLKLPADFYKSAKYIQPHWCRVESDVVTYNMHIILRYECEKRLFSEELDVDDIPRFWNEKMLDYKGLTDKFILLLIKKPLLS